MKLAQQQLEDIYETLIGTPDTGVALAEEYEVELDEIESACADMGLERCEECEWWCDDGELADNDGVCDSCASP